MNFFVGIVFHLVLDADRPARITQTIRFRQVQCVSAGNGITGIKGGILPHEGITGIKRGIGRNLFPFNLRKQTVR